jgi:PhnB protein
MAGKVSPIPEGFRTVTPHMTVSDGRRAIEFYKKAFGAEEICCMPGPGGQGVMHAELKIGDSMLMLNEEFPGCEQGPRAPSTLKGTTITVHLYVDDADAVFNRAVAAGATPAMPPMDAFWGDRYGCLVDPFGHQWGIGTHKEDLTPEEIGKRAEAFFAQMAEQAKGH